jgi:hypothetical protein
VAFQTSLYNLAIFLKLDETFAAAARLQVFRFPHGYLSEDGDENDDNEWANFRFSPFGLRRNVKKVDSHWSKIRKGREYSGQVERENGTNGTLPDSFSLFMGQMEWMEQIPQRSRCPIKTRPLPLYHLGQI